MIVCVLQCNPRDEMIKLVMIQFEIFVLINLDRERNVHLKYKIDISFSISERWTESIIDHLFVLGEVLFAIMTINMACNFLAGFVGFSLLHYQQITDLHGIKFIYLVLLTFSILIFSVSNQLLTIIILNFQTLQKVENLKNWHLVWSIDNFTAAKHYDIRRLGNG